MFQAPKTPVKRKLDDDFDFDSPREEASSSNGISWEYEGVDLDAKIAKLRDQLVRENVKDLPKAVPDPRSPLRTEYRKMQNSIAIATEAAKYMKKKIDWMEYALAMSTNDETQLDEKRRNLAEHMKNLRKDLDKMNANISTNTQKAVKTVVELYEDDYENCGESEEDNRESYDKFTKISKLCKIALDSFQTVLKRIEELEKEVVKLRRNLKAIQSVCKSTETHPIKYNKCIAHLTENLNLSQLQSILQSIKK
ncbi:unnamed protein product [Caenorhabditis angaria]|uniref:Uncharacterized protein n=1 Tax=Caenorhabditis angaria TaxID=860376 RepID=A0A9P1I3I0_9PELO|nr:unnamed protein product [Caenorhabditis angaria]